MDGVGRRPHRKMVSSCGQRRGPASLPRPRLRPHRGRRSRRRLLLVNPRRRRQRDRPAVVREDDAPRTPPRAPEGRHPPEHAHRLGRQRRRVTHNGAGHAADRGGREGQAVHRRNLAGKRHALQRDPGLSEAEGHPSRHRKAGASLPHRARNACPTGAGAGSVVDRHGDLQARLRARSCVAARRATSFSTLAAPSSW